MKLPIRTNMGNLPPQGKLIGKRELYVYENEDTDTYELWVGDPDEGIAKELTVNTAHNAKSVNTGKLLSVSTGANEGTVAGLKVNVVSNKEGRTVDIVTIEPTTVTSDVTLSSVTLNDIKRLIVSSENFGTDPNEVTEPQHGQLYFKI